MMAKQYIDIVEGRKEHEYEYVDLDSVSRIRGECFFVEGGREGVTTTSDESTWQPLRYLQYVPTSSNHTSSTKHDKSHLMHRLLHRGKDTKGIRCRIEDGLEVRRR